MMDLIGTIEVILIFSSIIILPLIYIQIRGKKKSSQYQKRISQDWRNTASYREGGEYLKVMRIDEELDKNKQRAQAK